MISFPGSTRLAILSILIAGSGHNSLAAQGLGGSMGVGVYRSLSPAHWDQSPGVGAEVMGSWDSGSGRAVGFGVRYVGFQRADDRLFLFIDGRYAPATSVTRRLQPIIGLRAGPYYGGGTGNGDGSPLIGLEAAPFIGLSLRAGQGVSLTLLGHFGIVVNSNAHLELPRRFFPGLQMGVTLH